LSATTGESPCCLMIALLMLEPFRRIWVLSKVEADGTRRTAASWFGHHVL
jgi:hypothetical protein